MDPNEALKVLRGIMRAVNSDTQEVSLEDIGLAAEVFDSLDTWLSSGGFLPKAWEKKGKRGRVFVDI